MRDWQERAYISADVVFFNYVAEDLEKKVPEVFVWDLDKTYLDTKWGNLTELLNTALEKAFNKKNVPGTAALVVALKSSWEDRWSKGPFPIYFITASPPQLENRILEKLHLDGIFPFGMFFKDNLQNLRPGRLWRLTQQIGYKLQALLELRVALKEDVRQVLWGDDSESDAVIYSLYSDICARRLSENDIRELLRHWHVGGQQTETILELQSQIPNHDPVEKVYINLASDTDADYYLKFGRRTCPTTNTFQAALDLFQDNRLKAHSVVSVAQDMVMNYAFTHEELERSLDDLIRRNILAAPTVETILPLLIEHHLVAKNYRPSVEPRPIKTELNGRIFELEGVFEPWVPERIDYFHDYR